MWIPTTAVDTYLVLRRGQGRDGQVVDSNDNVGSRNFNSSINRVLTAGTYTVEVTTCFGGLAEDFTPSVRLPTCVENLGPLTARLTGATALGLSVVHPHNGRELCAFLHLYPDREDASGDQPDLRPVRARWRGWDDSGGQ